MHLCPRTILAVEDSDDEIFFLRMAFAELGYGERVFYARDGKEAVDYLSGVGKYGDRSMFPFPCVVLTDLKMPGMSGLELIKWLREESTCKTMLIYAFTSSLSARDVEEARGNGVTGYFQKPGVRHSLILVLKEIESSWHIHLSACTGNPPRSCEGN